jgi:putative aldouronate transport system permease protein
LTTGWFRRLVQSISYLPYFISTVIIVGILKQMASQTGLFNHIGHLLGLPPTQFFADPGWFRPLFIGSGIWQTLGWSAIIYLAALAGVDPELYDAAAIDGVNRVQRAAHVTLPSIAPTVMILLILSVGGILGNDYQKVLLMQSPTNLTTSQVIGTWVYQTGILNADFGEAAAVGLMLSVLAFIFVLAANWFSRRLTEHSLW